jgi:hypothetical protein
MEATRNNSCAITIVGYHGNSVYRVVASIPIWVTVTSLAKFLTYGRFPWKTPTHYSEFPVFFAFYYAYLHTLYRGSTLARNQNG